MSKSNISRLKDNIQHLKNEAPSGAKKYSDLVGKVERRLSLIENRSFLDTVLFKKKENLDDIEKELNLLLKNLSSIKKLDTEIDGVSGRLSEFCESIQTGVKSDYENMPLILHNNQEFCKTSKLKINEFLHDCTDSVKITSANEELKRISKSLIARKESVRLLKKVDELSREYSGAENINDIYDLFENIEKKYDDENINEKLKEVDSVVDSERNKIINSFPPPPDDTKLRNIGDWIRELDKEEEEKQDVILHDKEYERLRKLSHQLETRRFVDDNSEKYVDLDRETLILLDDVKFLTEKLKEKKIKGYVPLLEELKSHFLKTDDSLLRLYSNLSVPVNSAEDYRKWRKAYEQFKREFNILISNKIAELGRTVDHLIRQSKEEVEKIRSGPCSSEISTEVKVLDERVKKAERTRQTAENEKMIAALIDSRAILESLDSLKEKVEQERKVYEQDIDNLVDKTNSLDKEINRSSVNFKTLSTLIRDKISGIDSNKDISLAIKELEDINNIVEDERNLFYKTCKDTIDSYSERCFNICKVFEQLRITYDRIDTDEYNNVVDSLLYHEDYYSNLNKLLDKNFQEYELKKLKAIDQVTATTFLSDMSRTEKEELESLLTSLKSWKSNSQEPEESLLSLHILLLEVDTKIRRFIQEESKARKQVLSLKRQIEEINKNYDAKYFYDLRKSITGIVYGVDNAKDNWVSVNQQLELADKMIKQLDYQLKRIFFQELDKDKEKLRLYVNKQRKKLPSDNDALYKRASLLLERLENTGCGYPSRLDKLELENLLMEVEQ